MTQTHVPLPRTAPASVDVDPQAIADWITAIARSGQELHSVMILRHGQVIAEGWTKPWRREHQRLLYSLSKTFCSAAVGIAVADGALGYDETLAEIFPDQAGADVGPKAASIRLRDVLSMASGHTEDMISLVSWQRPALNRDTIGAFLRHEPAGTPGETFCYNQICTWSAARAVHERTGIDVHDLLKQRVFPALGITTSTWATDADGRSMGFSGLHVQTEAIAEFFQLIADGGVRDGQQLLAPEWIERHRQKQVDNVTAESSADWSQGYGWQVWMAQHGYRGDGAFGQWGMLLPEQGVVIASQSACPDMQTFLDVTWEVLLPGIDRTPDDVDEGQAALDAALAGLHLPTTVGESGGSWAGVDADGGALALTEDGPGWTCTWTDGSGATQTFPVGHGEWVETRLTWGDRSLRVAASAGSTGAGHRIDLVCLNTPHRCWLELPAGGDQASFTWFQEPLGPTRPWMLAQPFDDALLGDDQS